MIKKIALYGRAGSGKDYVANELIKYLKLCTTHDAVRFAFADSLKEHAKNILNIGPNIILEDSEDIKNNTYVNLDDLTLQYHPNVKYESNHDHNYPTVVNGYLFDYSAEVDVKVWTAQSLGYEVGLNLRNNISISEIMKGSNDVVANLITYREFIVYLGSYIIQRAIGRDYFINKVFNSRKFDECIFNDDFIIITDVRFQKEYERCKDENFFIIEVKNESKDFGISNIAESNYNSFEPNYIFYNSYDKSTFDNNFGKLIKTLMDKDNNIFHIKDEDVEELRMAEIAW